MSKGPVLKMCPKCGKRKPLDANNFHRTRLAKSGFVSRCKSCANADNREWHKRNAEKRSAYYKQRRKDPTVLAQKADYMRRWQRENRNPIRAAATHAVWCAVKAGRLTPRPCKVCGAEPAHAHHCDYQHPLRVQWLCPKHHVAWHQKHKAKGLAR
jgi:hypothetical protein